MAISPIEVGDTSARAKMNAAIVEANKVAGKADAAALSAEALARATVDAALTEALGSKASTGALATETTARAQGDQAEAQARASAVAALNERIDGRATYAEVAAEHERPGEPGRFATPDLGGAPEAVSLLDGMKVVSPANGAVVAIRAGYLAPVAVRRIEPARQYRLRFVVQRAEDTADPANDAVRLGIAWLKADKSKLSETVIADALDITVSSGRLEFTYTVSRVDGDTIDIVCPAGAVYARPFVRCYGSGLTHVEVIEWTDLSNSVEWSPDVSEFRRQLAGMAFVSDDLVERMGFAEVALEQAHDARYIETGTLDDARLSENVLLGDKEQTVTGAKAFEAPLKLRDVLLIGDGEATGDGASARIVGSGDAFEIAPTDRAGGFQLTKTLGFDLVNGMWRGKGGFRAEGDLVATGAASAATLDIAGAADIGAGLSVGDDLIVTGDGDVGGGLTVTGAASAASLSTSGAAQVGTDLTVGDDLIVTDDASVGGDLSVAGATTIVDGSIDGATIGLTTPAAAKFTSATFTDPGTTRTSLDVYNKAETDARFETFDALVRKGAIDCSTNPNYPAANAGHVYIVSVAGRIGGASGPVVEPGDFLICNVDSSAAGNQAAIGANWTIGQVNIAGAVVGPASAVDATPMVADGSTGKLIKNITFAAFKALLALVKGDVGLGSVDNTSDASKPVSTAQQTALDLKAPKTAPVLVGPVGVGTPSGAGALHVALDTGFAWGAPWTNGAAVFGGYDMDDGAFGISYDDTAGAILGSIVPGSAWKPLEIRASEIILKYGGSNDGIKLASDGSTRIRTLGLVDGLTAPTAVVGQAFLYVDAADGDLKVKFGDGTVKTIVVDT